MPSRVKEGDLAAAKPAKVSKSETAPRTARTIRFGGRVILAGRFETRGGGSLLKVKCPKCEKFDSPRNYYLRDQGTRLFAHKPCEAARQKERHASA